MSILTALVLIFVLGLAVVSPGFRVFLGALLVLAFVGAIGIGLYWYAESEKGKRLDQVARGLVKRDEIEVVDARLSIDPLFGKFTGTVINNSRHHIEQVTVRVVVFDCPHGTDPKDFKARGCSAIGDTKVTDWSLNVPPGQKRAMERSVQFDNMPTVKEWTWFMFVEDIKARPAT